MLVQLGQRSNSGDVVDLLSECHGRIRHFLELASRLAATPEVEPVVVQATAGQVRRYFAEAFPLHLSDEDELIAPRLRGRSSRIDDALARLHADHVAHEPLVGAVIEVCTALRREPRRLDARAAELAAAAAALRSALEPHLLLEEREIFPALRTLPAQEREAIKRGMRDRRDVILSTTAQSFRH